MDRYIRGRWSSLLERKLRLLLHLLSLSPPLPAHIQFLYILSAAYHVIAETYAHKCADMCTGPGSTGRVRDTRCTAKNTINSSPPFLFSLFSLLLSPLLCSVVPFVFDWLCHIPPIYTPSESHLLPNLLISAQFSPNSPSPGVISSLARLCICAFLKRVKRRFKVRQRAERRLSLSNSQTPF